MPTDESENFYRLVSLLIDVGTPVLRRLVLKYAMLPSNVAIAATSGISPVVSFLVNNQGALLKVLTPDQFKLLIPSGGKDVTPEAWDISLLSYITKSICPLSVAEKQEIDALRQIRNVIYGHTTTASITSSQFDQHWKAIDGSLHVLLQALGDATFEKEVEEIIKKLKTGPLDIGSTVQSLITWYRQDQAISAQLEQLTEKVDDLRSEVSKISAIASNPPTNPVFKKMTDHARVILEDAKSKTFVDTDLFKEADRLLSANHVVLITSDVGDGRTCNALRLLWKNFQSDRCILINDSSQWEHVDNEKIDGVLFDDPFGKYGFDEDMFKKWLPVLEVIETAVRSRDIYVIMTSQRFIHNAYKVHVSRFEIFKHAVEIRSEEFSDDEKLSILKNEIKANNKIIDDETGKECVRVFDFPFGFPQCCHICASKDDLFLSAKSFFAFPFEFVQKFFKTLPKITHLSILLLFYKNGSINDSYLKPNFSKNPKSISDFKELLNSISELVNVNKDTVSAKIVKEQLERLTSVFLRHDNKTFTFSKRIVYEMVALVHSNDFPEEVIEFCDLEFLSKNIQIDTSSPGYLNVSSADDDDDVLECLVQRVLLEVIENKNLEKIIVSNIFENQHFCKCLLEKLIEKDKVRILLDPEERHEKGLFKLLIDSHSDIGCLAFIDSIVPFLKHDHVADEPTQEELEVSDEPTQQKLEVSNESTQQEREVSYKKSKDYSAICGCTEWQCMILAQVVRQCCMVSYKQSLTSILKANILKAPDVLRKAIAGWELEMVRYVVDIMNEINVFDRELCDEGVSIAKKMGHGAIVSLLKQKCGNDC